MPLVPLTQRQKNWIVRFAVLAFAGILVFIVGIDPDLIGLNLTEGVGIVQISVWLAGLGMVLIGGFAAVRIVRNGRLNSLRAEIGIRLIATGYVFSAVASLADHLGIGTQRFPILLFGRIQVIGLALGIFVSLIGLILYWPSKRESATEESGT